MLKARGKYVLAVDLGGTKVCAATVDGSGRILRRFVEPVARSSMAAPIAQINDLAETLAGGSVTKTFAAIAVAVPGLVRRSGTVWAPNLPGWQQVALSARLERMLGIKVVVESDRAAAVLGEIWRGAARGKSDAIMLIVGTGIGAGIVSGGRLVRGGHELAGCAGWLVVSDCQHEEVSRCGQLETFAAGPAVARAAAQAIRAGTVGVLARYCADEITARDVADAARQGDACAQQIFRNFGTVLGRGVANLISLFDPEVVILGGGMAAASDLYLDSLKSAALQFAQPLAARQVKIRVSRLGGDANLLGAARLAWDATNNS